jgi:hypothetical protein
MPYSLRQVVAPVFKQAGVVLNTDIFPAVGGLLLQQQLKGASKFIIFIQVQGAATTLKMKVKERGVANEIITVLLEGANLPQAAVKRIEVDVDSKFEYNFQLGATDTVDLLQVIESRSGI